MYMANSTDVMSQIFNKANLSPKEQVTDWETGAIKKTGIGSKIAGKFAGFWLQPENNGFKAQTGVALVDLADDSKVYGINLSEFFKDRLAQFQIGDLVGFEYTHDKPNGPGKNATKVIRMFNLSETERVANGEVSKGNKMFVETDNETSETIEETHGDLIKPVQYPSEDINPEDIPF